MISNHSTWIAFASVARRLSQTPLQRMSSTIRNLTNQKSQFAPLHKAAVPWLQTRRCLLSLAHCKKTPTVFIRRISFAQKRETINASSGSGVTPLGRVEIETQRSSRRLVRGTGKRAHIDPNVTTKDATAYCAAEKYDLDVAKKLLENAGYEIDPNDNQLFPQVLHVRTPNGEHPDDRGHVFVFVSGSMVTWDVPETVATLIVSQILPAAAQNDHIDRIEVEDLRYIEDCSRKTSRIIGDTIILGCRTSPLADSTEIQTTSKGESRNHKVHLPEADKTLAMVAFSSALARSAKLAVLEQSLNHYFESTETIVSTLSSGRKLRFTRAFLLRKTGELLSIRAQLNLYSELTDSLPDLFWDSPHELGLENYYETAGRALDVSIRIRTLNDRLDYAREIAEVLRERLSEKHSTGLEWLIIGLISIEVGFGILHLWNERSEHHNPRSTQSLLNAWLEQELSNSKLPESSSQH